MDGGDVLSMDTASAKVRGEDGKVRALRFELKKQYPGYDVQQCNIIMLLGGWSRDLDLTMRKLFGSRGYDVFRRMQKVTKGAQYNFSIGEL